MSPLARFSAALLLAVLVPVQGYAAACAQICAATERERQAEVATPADDHEPAGGHCHDSEPQPHPGKCCSAHTFLFEPVLTVPSVQPPELRHTSFVARWTNFIPEEPSPPPIARFRSP